MDDRNQLLDRIQALEDREKDLLVAAEIGKTLLEKNIELTGQLELVINSNRELTELNGSLQQKLLFSSSEKEMATRRVNELEQELSEREIVVKELKKRMQTAYVTKEKYQQLVHEVEFLKMENQKQLNEHKEFKRQVSTANDKFSLNREHQSEMNLLSSASSSPDVNSQSKKIIDRSGDVQKLTETNKKLNDEIIHLNDEIDRMKDQLIDKEKLSKTVSSLLKANRQLQEEHEEYKRLLQQTNDRLAQQKELNEDKRMSEMVIQSVESNRKDTLEVEIEQQVAQLVKQQSELILKEKRDELNKQIQQQEQVTRQSEQLKHDYELLLNKMMNSKVESHSIGIQTESVDLEIEPERDPLIISQLQEEISKVRGEFAQVVQTLEEESEKCNKLQKESFEIECKLLNYQQLEDELRLQIDQLEKDRNQKQIQLESSQKQNHQLQNDLQSIRKGQQEIHEQLEDQKNQLHLKDSQLINSQRELKESKEEVDRLKNDLETIRSEEQMKLDQLVQQINAYQDQANRELIESKKSIEQENEQQKQTVDELRQEYSRLQTEFKDLLNRSNNVQTELVSSQMKLVQQQQQFQDKQKLISQLQTDNQHLQSNVNQLRAEIEQIKLEEKSRLQSYLRKRKLHDEMNKQKQSTFDSSAAFSAATAIASPIASRRLSPSLSTSSLENIQLTKKKEEQQKQAQEIVIEKTPVVTIVVDEVKTTEIDNDNETKKNEEAQFGQLMESLEKESELRAALQTENTQLIQKVNEFESELNEIKEKLQEKQNESEENQLILKRLENEFENSKRRIQVFEIDREQTKKLINDLMKEKQERSRLLTTMKSEWEEDRFQNKKQVENLQNRIRALESKKVLLEQQSKKFERQLLDVLDKQAESRAFEEDIMQSVIKFREYIQDAQSTVLSQKMKTILERDEMYQISNTVLESVLNEAKVLLSKQGEAKMYGRSKEWVCQLYELVLNCAEIQLKANKLNFQLNDELLAKNRIQEELDTLKKTKKKGIFGW